jgi:hypothetical protein
MRYSVKAIQTKYRGVVFRSRLEAKWAAFFDLLKWRWTYEPCDLAGWSPDFLLHFSRPTRGGLVRSFCLLAEVKPYADKSQFGSHACAEYPLHQVPFECDGAIGLGLTPSVTWIEVSSDSEGTFGECGFDYLVSADSCEERVCRLWRKASNRVQWKFDANGNRK